MATSGARTLLRERGMASAGKRAGRATTEGLVGFLVDDARGSIVGIGCETEPRLQERGVPGLRAARAPRARRGRGAADGFEQERQELIARLGENIVVIGAERFDASGDSLAGYAHPPANKIGVLVRLRGGSAELARQVAMHIAFAAPEVGRA